MKTFGFIQQTNIVDQLHDVSIYLFIYLFIHFNSIYRYVLLWEIKYNGLYCLLQTGSEGKKVEET